ncbi:hypothetical protein [Nocardia beijingensis]|uniref:hypothetical protein n=1 Tax=Nocardia beijingensis TaxID=95162 RepID=UPI000A42AC57|nr:hypothetical protein [Nocardia beijingensis]
MASVEDQREDGAFSSLRNPDRYSGEIDVLAGEAGWILDDLDNDLEETVRFRTPRGPVRGGRRGHAQRRILRVPRHEPTCGIEYLTTTGVYS